MWKTVVYYILDERRKNNIAAQYKVQVHFFGHELIYNK